jgi:DNA modification methylase
MLAKNERYFFDNEAVKEAAISTHPSGNGYDRAERVSVGGRGQKQGWSDIGDTRNIRNVWTIGTQPYAEAHFATFPPELAERCIKAGCLEGGTVLDPFGGAGTTGLVADRLRRSAILIELNPDYAAIAERRLSDDGGMFAEVQREAAE